MIIRQALTKDAPAIATIANALIRDSLVTFTTDERSVKSVAADIESKGPAFLVAEIDGMVAGFASFGNFRPGPGYAQCREHSIQLTPQARGQGVGRALMDALEDRAIAEKVHILVAGISSANPAAIAFHSAIGFEQVGRMPEVGLKWGQRLDLILMQKILGPQSSVAPDTREKAG
ncbi:GNAT family N-acetyltransferase [uncultured Ruegeria sp.]|uniref:GNAT family N-acetyltransferase n=1 Tax=uncultured Ruegeria sp. TaxID=259304 RepID=UPI00261ACE33|nr:GNAT family N-acetyltransferase [uncultured Ruegeria sp.]